MIGTTIGKAIITQKQDKHRSLVVASDMAV